MPGLKEKLLTQSTSPSNAGLTNFRPGVIDHVGVLWNRTFKDKDTGKDTPYLSGTFLGARISIFPNRRKEAEGANPKMPDWTTSLSSNLSQDQREALAKAGERPTSIQFAGFWENPMNNGDGIYLSSTVNSNADRPGVVAEIFPVTNKQAADGPDWRIRLRQIPVKAKDGGQANGQANGEVHPGDAPEPDAKPSQDDEIPF